MVLSKLPLLPGQALTGDSKLPTGVDVSGNGCRSLCVRPASGLCRMFPASFLTIAGISSHDPDKDKQRRMGG